MASGISGLNLPAPDIILHLVDNRDNPCTSDCVKEDNITGKGKKIKPQKANYDAFMYNSTLTKKLNTEKSYMKMRSKKIESTRKIRAQAKNTRSGYKNGRLNKTSPSPPHKCSNTENRWHWQPLVKGLKNFVDRIRQLLVPEENTLVDLFDWIHPEALDPYQVHSNTSLTGFNFDAMGSLYCLADDNPYLLTGDSDRLLEYEIVKRWQAKSLMSTILLNDEPQQSHLGNRHVGSVSTCGDTPSTIKEIVKRWQAKSLMSTILLNDEPQQSHLGNRHVGSVSTCGDTPSTIKESNSHSVYLPD